eukprot:NODE_482_length_7826_cov_0.560114.p5 type:complete len:124 gc:universal NODE_482_length_7826_cov_0.560114:6956-7327(+)
MPVLVYLWCIKCHELWSIIVEFMQYVIYFGRPSNISIVRNTFTRLCCSIYCTSRKHVSICRFVCILNSLPYSLTCIPFGIIGNTWNLKIKSLVKFKIIELVIYYAMILRMQTCQQCHMIRKGA